MLTQPPKSKSTSPRNIRFPRTDTGNAELIVALFGDVLRYDYRQGRWLIWSKRNRRWSEDKADRVRTFAIRAARHRRRVSARLADSDTSKQESIWSYDSEDRHKLDAALEIAKSLSPISDPGSGWDADLTLFGVKNGVVDLRTGKLRAERPRDRITKHSPVSYDPVAKCPRFEQYLQEIFNGQADLIDYVQRVAGYCLTGSDQEQCLFCFYGSGANGKSRLVAVLGYILGPYAVNLPFSALEMRNPNSNDLVSLAGSRFATASETNDGVRLNEARLKMLTGGDLITAKKLYHEHFTFQPTHKLVLAFNHKPVIADDSEGMWRRMRLIPFLRQFKGEEQDNNLLAKLIAEAEGILAWAVRGCLLIAEAEGILAWAVRGCLLWQKKGLRMPPAVAEATAAYREESDHVGDFIEDCCLEEPGAIVAAGVLWDRYQRWTAENEEVRVSRTTFAERLQKRGFRNGRNGHGGTRIWVGIRLRQGNGAEHAQTPCRLLTR